MPGLGDTSYFYITVKTDLLKFFSFFQESMEKQVTQNRKLNSKTEKLISYNSIAALSGSELKKLCSNFKIDINFPKKANIIFLCHALGVSTTGGPSKNGITSSCFAGNGLSSSLKTEYQLLSPKFLSQQKNWSKDLLRILEIEESDVKKYLLNISVLDASSDRTYKLSRPFQLNQFVHSVVYLNKRAQRALERSPETERFLNSLFHCFKYNRQHLGGLNLNAIV